MSVNMITEILRRPYMDRVPHTERMQEACSVGRAEGGGPDCPKFRQPGYRCSLPAVHHDLADRAAGENALVRQLEIGGADRSERRVGGAADHALLHPARDVVENPVLLDEVRALGERL